ncbi:eukaryotic translation initiation factor 5 [Trichodelitschia bisporula]|uniref:Eukaryotic translation initiation factor 5 n=1 Tax=Trichodelitschia bisporula TaxID=703511 RepID=A0A6G1HYB4_9PEZI|nr:eukaryotic translation initiation factor 5 [Trichodelitschia bisporula]
MANINIRRDVTDPYYRYKMERLQSKIEGKGNGIKTVIVNLSSVAQSLARPPAYVIKYFGFELGAQTNINPTDDRWIINGAHEASKLQDYLDGFISRFVLCKKCKNPETDVHIKDGTITLDCKACGQRSNVDVRLKLSSFILKNQPKKGKKDKASKKAERKGKKDATNGDDDEGSVNGKSPADSNSDGAEENGDVEQYAGSDDELTRRINADAKAIDDAEHADIKWSVDTSEAAVRARAKELPTDMKRALVLDEEDVDEAGNVYETFGNWITEEAEKAGGVDKVDNVAIYLKAKELGIEAKSKTLTVLAQTLFTDKIVKEIPTRVAVLRRMVTSEKHEKALLGGTERFVGKEHPELISQMSAILLQLYHADLISEEVALAWGKKASKRYVDLATSKKVRLASRTFIEWLEKAESEDEEDSDEEEEEEGEEE